jgi:predicted secreted protein
MNKTNADRLARGVFVGSFLLAAAIGLSGCLVPTHVLSDADGGKIRAVDVGDEVLIRLSGNASTGFQWERTAPIAFADTPLEPIREGSYKGLGSALGIPGFFSFRYSAVRQGTVTLTFTYLRTWEDEPPLATYTVVIWVR